MLGAYVDILNQLIEDGRVGRDSTQYTIASALGITRYKAKKMLGDLCEFGMVYVTLKEHRPSVMKSTYEASIGGALWAQAMTQKRML